MLSDISPIPMDGKPFSFTKRNANKAAAYIRNALGDAYIVDVVDAEFESAQKDLGPGIRISFTNRPEFFTAWANIHTVKITPYTVRILNSKGNTLIKRFNKTPAPVYYHNSDDLAHAINCLVEVDPYICDPVSSNEIKFTTKHGLPVRIIRRDRYILLLDEDDIPVASLPIHEDYVDTERRTKSVIVIQSDGTDTTAKLIDRLIGWNLRGIETFPYTDESNAIATAVRIVVNAGGMSFDLFKDDELEIRLSDSSQPINIISRAQYEPMELELHGATEDICEESAEDIWRLIDDLASAEIAVSVWRETLKGYSVDLIDASIIRVKRASTRNVWTFPLGTCWATPSPGAIDISMPGTEEVLHLYTEGGSPTETAQTHDPVNHPSHYTAYKGLEIIDLTEQMNFNRGNAVKYIARAGLKGAGDKEIEDLEKANWYISREIQRLREASSSRVVDRTFHSEDTLARVYTVIQQECGLDRNDTEQVVLSLLNNGILFRERA